MKTKTTQFYFLLLLFFSFLLINCTDDKNPMITPTLPAEFQGIWRSEGYGYVVDAKADQITVYEETSVTLVELAKAVPSGNRLTLNLSLPEGDVSESFTLMRSGDKLIVEPDDPGSTSLAFNRIQNLPPVTVKTGDPEINFEVFWHAFEEHYAFFALRNVDWNAQYQVFRSQVNSATSETELYNIMSAMIQPLEDGHVVVCSNSGCYSAGLPHPLGDRLNEYQPIILQTYLNGNFSVEANGQLVYGNLTDSIGYLEILGMEGFSASPAFSAQESALASALGKIIRAFKDLPAVVIDVRFNGGGADIYSRIIASRFADQRRLAYSKQARNGGYDEFNPPEDYFVEPGGAQQFTKKIALLTSKATASGAEVFTMSLMPYPYVTRIGEPTNGIFSDILIRLLPNGWFFGLSNERYFSFEMVNYEKTGVPPHIEVWMSEEDLTAGKDSVLDSALAFLQGNDRF